MSDTRTHTLPESSSGRRAIGYRRPRRVDEPTPTEYTLAQTRVFRRETERSAGVGEGGLIIRIINEHGKPEKAIRCKTISQCREVVRVESPLYEPGALFFIADGNLQVETWAIGKDGLPKRGRVR